MKNRSEFFSKELREAVSGMGIKDQAVIHLVVSRSEIDLGNFKQSDMSLEQDLQGDVSGDYKAAIVAIIKE